MEHETLEAFIFRGLAYGLLGVTFLYAVWEIFFPAKPQQKEHFAILPPIDEEFGPPRSPLRRRWEQESHIIDVPIIAETTHRRPRKQTQMLFDRGGEMKMPALPAPKAKKVSLTKKDEPVVENNDEVAFVQVETKTPTQTDIKPPGFNHNSTLPLSLQYTKGVHGEIRYVSGKRYRYSITDMDWHEVKDTPPVENPMVFNADNTEDYKERMATAMHANQPESVDVNKREIDKVRAYVDGRQYPVTKTIFCQTRRAWIVVEDKEPATTPTIQPLVRPVSLEAVGKVNKVLLECGMTPIPTPPATNLTEQQLKEKIAEHVDLPREYRGFASGS